MPYVEQLCGKLVKWEIGMSITWIGITIITTIITLIFSKVADWDGLEKQYFGVLFVEP